MGVNLSLRLKLLLLTFSVVICFGATISFYVATRVASDFTGELLKRGVSIATHIADGSAGAFIENDHVQLRFLAQNHQVTEPDIRYVLMTDRDGELFAHSFGATFPVDLKTANRYIIGQPANIRRLDTGNEIVYDIAVPVLDGRLGGVRIGVSAAPIRTTVNTFIKEILLAILVFGVIAFAVTLPAAQVIARPISRLTRAIEALTKGRRDLKLPVHRRDEFGVLNDAFNQMAVDVDRAEKRLAAQINFLQVLMEDLPIPVFYKDCSLQMLGCNRAYAEFWGKRIDEIVGRFPEELYPPPEAALHRARDEELLRDERDCAYEQVVIGADGRSHDIIFHKAPFRDEDGRPAGIIGVMHDVTPQRAADRVKDEFVSTVAHEFQTPLATILGFSELLQENSLSEDDRQDALRTIVRKAESLSQMVDELLDLARLESGHPLGIDKTSCDINQLLIESVESFDKRLAMRRFVLDLPTPPVVIKADCRRLGQVMENLLSNAVKYSGAASTISLAVIRSEGLCHIVVRDEGIGMTAIQLEHLFDKFYRVNTTRTAPAGTGLGLFIVKSIIEAHHGEIRIDSAPGRGTTVTVLFPCEASD